MTQEEKPPCMLSIKRKRLEKHKIEGAINRDWEDIAQDSTHYFIAIQGITTPRKT